MHAPEFGHRALAFRRPIDRRVRSRAVDADAEGHWQAHSPMPGTVIDVPFAVGDLVSEGDTVAVVEAMKMEHALRSPWQGRIADVMVTPGATVARHDVLVIVEPRGKDD